MEGSKILVFKGDTLKWGSKIKGGSDFSPNELLFAPKRLNRSCVIWTNKGYIETFSRRDTKKEGSDPSIFVSLLEKVSIYPFLVQITHDLLSPLGAKRVDSERGLNYPFYFWSPSLLGISPLKKKFLIPPFLTKIVDAVYQALNTRKATKCMFG